MALKCNVSRGNSISSDKQAWCRSPASADRTARRQFQATGQPVSRTQASDAMTSRLPRNVAKCVQRRCFQWGSVPLRSDIKGMELPLPVYGYNSRGNWLRYNFATDSWNFAADFSSFIVESVQKTTNLGTLSPFWGSRGGVEPWVDGSLESPCRVLVKCNWASFF